MPGHLSEGWRRLGCRVEEFFYGSHMGKSWKREGRQANHRINLELLYTARRLRAEGRLDLIFAVIYDDVLEEETAQQLRLLQVPMVNYHVDLVGQWHRVLRTGKYFDRLACAQRDHWSALRRAEIRPWYMPMASNPPASAKAADDVLFDGVLYLGSPWEFRRRALSEIAHAGLPLRVFGHGWQTDDRLDESKAQPWLKILHDLRYYAKPYLAEMGVGNALSAIQRRLRLWRGRPSSSAEVPGECLYGEYSDAMFDPLVKGAAINLGFAHFSNTPGTHQERRQLRLRDFEIPMAGGFYLAQDCAQLRELFHPGVDIATWDSMKDLLEKIRYYLAHPAERRRLSAAGQAHVRKHHTWERRFRDLLRDLNLPVPRKENG
ncbi:MAG: glycosyltransferase [Elusimicrobiota bacterium]